MQPLNLSDPVFATCAVAACLMILKTVSMAWAFVWRMGQVKGGYRSPEDAQATRLNPAPHPGQVGPDDRVDRFRRIHQNDLENVPFFLATGFLFVLTGPPLLTAQILFYGYVLWRFLHLWAYATARTHDTRATFWTIGVLMIMGMALWVIWVTVNGGM